jgi:hypothetical protein
MAAGASHILGMIESGEKTVGEFRAQAEEMPPDQARALNLMIDLAETLQQAPKAQSVAEPKYRKGTGRKVISWADCIWRPTP